MPHRRTLVILAMAFLPACAVYHPAPLEPVSNQSQFNARTLQDPAFQSWLKQRIPQQPPATTDWTFDRLSFAALYFHPDIAVARAKLAAAAAGKQTAGEMPNPSVSFNPEKSANPGDQYPWVLGFSFDIPIETAGKRDIRIKQANATITAAQWDLAATAWQVRARLRDALLEFLFDQRTLESLQNEVTARSANLEVIDRRLKAGEASRPDVTLARIDLLTSRQALRAAQGQLADARTKLAAAIGLPTAALKDITFLWPNLDTPPEPLTADDLQSAGLTNRLDVQRSLAEYAAAEAALELEIAKQYPDIHLGPGYTYDQGQRKFQLGVSLTLPILNQNGGAIQEAWAHRTELAARFLALQAQAVADTESAIARYQSALDEFNEAHEALAASQEQYDSLHRALAAGDQDRLSVTGGDVQRQVAARLRIDALHRAMLAKAALEDAIQRPLFSSPSQPAPPATQEKP